MAINITAYRLRTDTTKAQGGTPVWAGPNNNVPIGVIKSGTPFRIRYQIADGSTADNTSYQYKIWIGKNGGPFVAITSTGDLTYADATLGTSTNGSNITTQLMGALGGSTFLNTGLYCPAGVASKGISIGANCNTEFEFGLQFNSPGCDGNYYNIFVSYTSFDSTNINNANYAQIRMPQRAALALTEANDTLAGVMLAPNAGVLSIIEVGDGLAATGFVNLPIGILNATEANDVLTGVGVGTAVGVLARTEANDGLTGTGFVPTGTGLTANLAQTEASDVLTGVGTGSGDVASLRQTEANDSLTAFAGSKVLGALSATENDDWISSSQTVMYLNQWVPVPPTQDVWVPIEQIDSYMFEDVLEPVIDA